MKMMMASSMADINADGLWQRSIGQTRMSSTATILQDKTANNGLRGVRVAMV